MEKDNMDRAFVRYFALFSMAFLGIAAGIVILVDPFFHYHRPWFGLKAVFTQKKEYQVVGSIDHLEYDSILAGSSVVMNINTGILDRAYGSATIKAVGNSATTELLCWYLDRAFSRRDLQNVYYGFDIFALYAEITGEPISIYGLEYMKDKNPFNDVYYIWNKDVLGIDVPYMIYASSREDYDAGAAYSYAQYWTFSREAMLERFQRVARAAQEQPETMQQEQVQANLRLLTKLIEEHPDTEFKFFLPPYSILWWDTVYRNGMSEAYFYTMELSIRELLQYGNVEFYRTDFNNSEIIENLDNYMDMTHVSPKVNDQMAEEIGNRENPITLENCGEEINRIRIILEEFEEKTEREGWEAYVAAGE